MGSNPIARSNDHHHTFLSMPVGHVEPQDIWGFFVWGWGWRVGQNLIFSLRRGISLRSLGVGGFTPKVLRR